jgi:hypothetical protein
MQSGFSLGDTEVLQCVRAVRDLVPGAGPNRQVEQASAIGAKLIIATML